LLREAAAQREKEAALLREEAALLERDRLLRLLAQTGIDPAAGLPPKGRNGNE
jgi:hypothetical protein